MDIANMTYNKAVNFCKNNLEAAAHIILMVEKLELRIKELEDKLGMNSANSSKPPSIDNKLTRVKKPIINKNHKGSIIEFSKR